MGYAPARHHDLIIDHLQRMTEGEFDRLMILMPPGSAKSMYASQLFPPWFMVYQPKAAIVAASHTQELADRFGRKVRNTIKAHTGVLGIGVSDDSRAAGRFETTTGGEYFSVGVGGSVTGRRADLIIIDDPVKSKEAAESETQREATWEWFTNDLYTRAKPGCKFVLIMTRWHEEDLGGRLISAMETGGDQWKILKLPAFAVDADDPLGRAVNEPLWPGWEDSIALERKRKALGARDFGALFQQDPRPKGSSFFDEDSVLVDGAPVPMPYRPYALFAVMDTAVKTGSKNDGTGVTYFALDKFKNVALYILDWDIVQVEGSLLEVFMPSVYETLERLAQATGALMGSLGVFIEDKASGTILLQQASRRVDKHGKPWAAHPIASELTAKGKDERAIDVSGYFHRGMIKMTEQAYSKRTVYKGKSANHFCVQVFRFQLGVKDQADDLLDTVCYGAAIALGNQKGF